MHFFFKFACTAPPRFPTTLADSTTEFKMYRGELEEYVASHLLIHLRNDDLLLIWKVTSCRFPLC